MFRKSKRELESAKRYINSIEDGAQYNSMQIYWINFLESIYKCYHKVENELKRSAINENEIKLFLSKYNKERKTDQMLSYIENARGAETHTVQDTYQKQSGIYFLGNTVINELIIKNGEIEKADIPVGGVVLKDDLLLLDVINRGVTYCVPSVHMGESISNNPVEIGLKCISYYENFIKNAESFLIQSKKIKM